MVLEARLVNGTGVLPPPTPPIAFVGGLVQAKRAERARALLYIQQKTSCTAGDLFFASPLPFLNPHTSLTTATTITR